MRFVILYGCFILGKGLFFSLVPLGSLDDASFEVPFGVGRAAAAFLATAVVDVGIWRKSNPLDRVHCRSGTYRRGFRIEKTVAHAPIGCHLGLHSLLAALVSGF